MAHKKQGGSTALGRDSQAKRLGIKVNSGQSVCPGMIIVRQRGTKYYPGFGIRRGKDDTLYAIKNGKVFFKKRKVRRFDGRLMKRTFVCIEPVQK